MEIRWTDSENMQRTIRTSRAFASCQKERRRWGDLFLLAMCQTTYMGEDY
jgi:hypothetical protein